MKKISFLLVLLAIFMVIPFSVFADGEDGEVQVTATIGESSEVNVYLFRGEGCPHCQEAEEWFKSIEGEYGSLFKVVDYEVWNNQDNAALMDKVADARKEEVGGVPYIVIGNKSWNGFTTDFGSEMLEQIKSEYAQPVSERYDIVKLLPELANKENEEKEKNSDVAALLIIVIVTGAICFGIYKARKAEK